MGTGVPDAPSRISRISRILDFLAEGRGGEVRFESFRRQKNASVDAYCSKNGLQWDPV